MARKGQREIPQTLFPEGPLMTENRFDIITDADIDGAVIQVGLQHFVIGPPRPAMRIGTGAVEIIINGHFSDIDTLIDGFKAVKRLLKKQGLSR